MNLYEYNIIIIERKNKNKTLINDLNIIIKTMIIYTLFFSESNIYVINV